jgi:hypothetical protein
MLLGTGTLESSGSVRKLKRNELPLFRGESNAILHGNVLPVTTQDDDLAETPPP